MAKGRQAAARRYGVPSQRGRRDRVRGLFERRRMTLSAAVTAAPPVLTLATRAGRWVLVATVLGSALAAIDATVVGIALPAIGEGFHTSLTSLQWVITAYLLTLAGL